MEIPICPSCGGTAWSSVEELGGGSRVYALRAAGWTLVDSSLDLLETNYSCDGCGHDPSDDDDEGELWDLLGDIDTAPRDDLAADGPRQDVSLPLVEGERAKAAK
jgi:hypothetical protein